MKSTTLDIPKRPTKEESRTARKSYDQLISNLKRINSTLPEIEIEETGGKVKIPLKALKLLAEILESIGNGKPISIVPIATEMTTMAAAEMIGCSRPHLVKILERGEIPYTLVGKHRRIKFEDVQKFRQNMKQQQKQRLIDMMKSDEDLGLYDT